MYCITLTKSLYFLLGLCTGKSLNLGRGTSKDSRLLLLHCIFLVFYMLEQGEDETAKNIYFY